MSKAKILAVISAAVLVGVARSVADDTNSNSANAPSELFTIHENLHTGQHITYVYSDHYSVKSVATTSDPLMPKNGDTDHAWTVQLTILDVRDGSATGSVANVDPQSLDTRKDETGVVTKSPPAYAGKSVIITRHPDDSLTNGFPGDASEDDVELINNFGTPDEAWYPDKPIAVGDTWDDSAKVGKFSSMGPNDTIACKGRLDWVKTIDGRQVAQITHSGAIIYHEANNVEEDYTFGGVQLVDLASGVTTKSDDKGSSKFILSTDVPPRVLGGSEFSDHYEVVSGVGPNATTGASTTQP